MKSVGGGLKGKGGGGNKWLFLYAHLSVVSTHRSSRPAPRFQPRRELCRRGRSIRDGWEGGGGSSIPLRPDVYIHLGPPFGYLRCLRRRLAAQPSPHRARETRMLANISIRAVAADTLVARRARLYARQTYGRRVALLPRTATRPRLSLVVARAPTTGPEKPVPRLRPRRHRPANPPRRPTDC